jgi:ABC-type Na+ efflux pump permease subunit
VSPLKTKIPSKNLGRQRWAERFNSGVKGSMQGTTPNPSEPMMMMMMMMIIIIIIIMMMMMMTDEEC